MLLIKRVDIILKQLLTLILKSHLPLLGLIVLISCNSKSSADTPVEPEVINQKELCYLKFYNIDNRAIIYIDDKQVHDTGAIEWRQKSERTVILSDKLESGSHEIKVELINGVGVEADEFDVHWDIYYEIFLNGEAIDYVSEIDEDYHGGGGVVFTKITSVNIP